jgi:hypothetical protein
LKLVESGLFNDGIEFKERKVMSDTSKRSGYFMPVLMASGNSNIMI